MIALLNAIFPIFLLIFFGYFLKKISFLTDDFWQQADKFTYYILMPSLLVYKLSSAKLTQNDTFDMVYVGLFVIVLISTIFLVIYRFTNFSGASYTSIIQGAIRYNTYIFLAIVDMLYGDKGLVYGMIFITFAIPLLNFLSISAFAIYVDKENITYRKFINSIVKNPLIIACFLGGFINFTAIYIPEFISNTLAILSSCALALGLLSVGVGLEISQLRYAKIELLLSSFVKLVLFPVVMYFFTYLFEIGGLMRDVLIVFAAMPTAASAYILARELGGDTKLISSIITLQTLLSFITLSFVIGILI